jgi:CheY-like chemotaxis protein
VALKLLLADDNMTAQNLGKKILSEAGYEVVAVSNGAAALRKIAEMKPDVVVLDIYMPGYSGLEICDRLKRSPETADLPVLLTVGKMEPFKAEEGQRVRADGVVVKPFEATDLLSAVQRVANGTSANGGLPEYERTMRLADITATMPIPEIERTMKLTPEMMKELNLSVPHAHDDALDALTAKPVAEPSRNAPATPAFNLEELDDTGPAAGRPKFEASSVAHVELLNLRPEAQPAAPVPDAEASGIFTVQADSPATADDTQELGPLPESSSGPIRNVTRASEPKAAEVSAAPEIEFTAAPKVGDVPVQPAVGLEPTILPDVQLPSAPARDPGLVTDPDEMIRSFPTRFGVESAEEETPVSGTGADTSSEATTPPSTTGSTDSGRWSTLQDFEAHVAAAMAAYRLDTAKLKAIREESARAEGQEQQPARELNMARRSGDAQAIGDTEKRSSGEMSQLLGGKPFDAAKHSPGPVSQPEAWVEAVQNSSVETDIQAAAEEAIAAVESDIQANPDVEVTILE